MISLAASEGDWTESPVVENGADSAVATVPGWIATQMDSGLLRFSSIAAVRISWLSAALDAR